MRITRVSVKKLFGMFDHDIPLNQDSRITIIYGPNGIGKTVLLSLLHGLFHCDYEFIGETPFEQFRIEFEGGAFITVEKSKDGNSLLIQFCDGDDLDHLPFKPGLLQTHNLNEAIWKRFPNLGRIEWEGKTYWLGKEIMGYMGYDIDPAYGSYDLDPPYGIDSPYDFHSTAGLITGITQLHEDLYGETPEWFEYIRKTSTVSIGVQRLRTEFFSVFHSDADRYVYEGDIRRSVDDVYVSNPAAVRYVSSKLRAVLSVENFPVDDVEGFQKLNELAEAEAKIEIGNPYTGYILDATMANRRLAERRQQLQSMFQQFVDKHQNESYFSEMMLFIDIINERFLFKSSDFVLRDGQVHPDIDFRFVADDGKEIPLSALSSGEQHLLVLYCELLFEVDPDTLVMIDEPELSMNVVWQRNFLKDLQRIIELRKFDVLIATHSPQVIHDKWDWMVALGESEGDS